VTIATALFAPKTSATKAVDRAIAGLGSTLTYNVVLSNSGQDAATTFADAIPAGAVLVPGSIRSTERL
jgi:uncharacterized repeat protein (TIGR01451 family)